MFDDLIHFTPPIEEIDAVLPLDKAAPGEILSAQVNTADWLRQMGVADDDSAVSDTQAALARDAFQAVTTATPDEKQKEALASLKTPPAVRHLTGMLTAYDWEFVEKAKELRSYTVSKILEETTHPDARIRLKALQMLGNVTEVALFTERVEVTKKDVSEQEIEARLRERLAKFLGPVEEVAVTDITPKELPAPVEPGLDEEIGAVAEKRGA